MAENNDDILSQFAQWLEEKQAKDKEAEGADDEIEVWNADGSGMRGKRSSLGAWLEKQGFTITAAPEEKPEEKETGKSGRQSKGSQSTNSQTSTARKYFATKTTGK